MTTMPLHVKIMLAPLLLSLAVSQAYATDLIIIGANGANGASAVIPLGDGGNGADGVSLINALTIGDSGTLTVSGGRGGNGGDGANEVFGPGMQIPPLSGAGGQGGRGGAANGSLTASRSTGPVLAATVVRGGDGGVGGAYGCCSLTAGVGGAGGAATSTAQATAASGSAVARAVATGGHAGTTQNGGAAVASGRATSTTGAASGEVRAVGGQGGSGQPGMFGLTFNPGNGGNASGALVVNAAGRASGDVTAIAGDGGGAYSGFGNSGTATATLLLSGAGATGSGAATGGYGSSGGASSVARALTTGWQAVDLTSTAHGGAFSAGQAETFVDARASSVTAGNADIRGRALADGGPYGQLANVARVTLSGNGAVTGISEARGNDGFDTGGCYAGCGPGANAESHASGISYQAGNVTITALAVGGAAGSTIPYGGTAMSSAYGQSATGTVTVRSESRSANEFSESWTRATAKSLMAGGSSHAEARFVSAYDFYNARAEASSRGSGGAKAVAIGEGRGGELSTTAVALSDAFTVTTTVEQSTSTGNARVASAANVGGALHALPAFDGTASTVSYATGLPAAGAASALLAGAPMLAGTDANWLGAGVMGISTAEAGGVGALVSAQYSFIAAAGQHLLVGLFGGQGAGSGGQDLSFSVSSNGVTLYTAYLYGTGLAQVFDDRLLDLGALGAGPQDVLITAGWNFRGTGANGFSYVLGVSAVPEPAAWLALLLGLATLTLVARRRRH